MCSSDLVCSARARRRGVSTVSLLKKLLGGKPAKKAAAQPKATGGASRTNTYVTSKTDRAKVIAEAMAVKIAEAQ